MSNKLPTDIPIDKAVQILDAIERQLNNRLQVIYDEKYNPNTKGSDYEQILAEFLQAYLGGTFDFQQRMGILDNELKIYSVLDERENEFDIVATYKNAAPKLVYHRLIPYDSIAFVIEAKQTLTTKNLKKDLAKFQRLAGMSVWDSRIRVASSEKTASGVANYKLKRPLRILFYYENKAKAKSVFRIFESQFRDSWDICLIQKEKVAILNSTLPYVQEKYPKAITIRVLDYPILKGIFIACASIGGNYVNSWTLFANLFRISEQTQKAIES